MAQDSQPRRLMRSRDRRLGGVLGGIAEYVGADPTLVRVVYILLLVLGFLPFGVLLYFILWIVMPLSPDEPARPRGGTGAGMDAGLLLGAILLIFGVLALLSRTWFSPWAWIGFGGGLGWLLHLAWPLLIIALGVWLVANARGRT